MSDFEEILPLAKVILKNHYLCDFCLGRLFSKKLHVSSEKNLGKKIKNELSVPKQRCYICKDLYETVSSCIKKMSEISYDYEFLSFVVGTKIKPSIIDRDDYIKSKFKIRAIDSIKTGIAHEISKQFSKKTKKKIDFLDPDVTFTIDFKEQIFQIRSKQLFLQGRYSKTKRGIPQKQKSCQNCSGKGCRNCDFHGIDNYGSVEGLISKFLFKKFGGTIAKFSWIGGEDKSSLVLAPGRPFFVRLQNPLKRKINLSKELNFYPVIIHNLKTIPSSPKTPLSFESVIEVLVNTKKENSLSSLKNLKNLIGSPIIFYETSGKKSEKKIFDLSFIKKSKHQFTLTIRVEGGFPVKRFVAGDKVEPGLSKTLQNNCSCERFDFLDIKMITNN
jgi:tRNA pseudouridine synthase 10